MSLKAVSIKNLAIINHNGNHYHVNFAFISKKDVYNLIKNAVIMGEKGTLSSKKINNFLSVHTIKMSLKKIKKQAISLDSVDLYKIVVSNKWKINETIYKYLCGYLNNDVIQPLCVIK